MSDLEQLTQSIIKFRDEREWSQFHNAKDLALSLVLESAELLEIFQWQEGEAIGNTAQLKRREIAAELADVLYWTLLIAHDLKIDLPSALRTKLEANAEKYPVEQAKGSNKKYTELKP